MSHFLGMLLRDLGSPEAPGNAGSGNWGAGCRNLEDCRLEEAGSDDQPSIIVIEITWSPLGVGRCDCLNAHFSKSSFVFLFLDFLGGSVVKNLPVNEGETSSIPGLGRVPWEGNGNPRQYPCLGNPMDRGAWKATIHGVAEELDMTYRLNNNILVSTFVRKTNNNYQ